MEENMDVYPYTLNAFKRGALRLHLRMAKPMDCW